MLIDYQVVVRNPERHTRNLVAGKGLRVDKQDDSESQELMRFDKGTLCYTHYRLRHNVKPNICGLVTWHPKY